VEKPKDLDKVFREYKVNVNMSCSQLLTWKRNPCAKKASLGPAPLNRNIRLACKPKAQWTARDVADAKRTIAFNSRMKAVKSGKAVKGCPSKRDISLKNWAWNPQK
jgi:hypothetical protein